MVENKEVTRLEALASLVGVAMIGDVARPWHRRSEWQKTAHGERVLLTYKGRRMTLDFYQGVAINHDPTASDILECLLSDASGVDQSFEDWAGDLGYDTDSRSAHATYMECVRQTARLQKFLGDDFHTFMDADR